MNTNPRPASKAIAAERIRSRRNLSEGNRGGRLAEESAPLSRLEWPERGGRARCGRTAWPPELPVLSIFIGAVGGMFDSSVMKALTVAGTRIGTAISALAATRPSGRFGCFELH